MRLEVTRKSDLAVRALIELGAERDRSTLPLKGSDLGDRVSTTGGFLAQVMTPLVRAGWVRSDPGPSGGYSLVADLAEVSVLAVIEEIEGPTDNGQCVLVDRPCNESGQCALHPAWMRARNEMLVELTRLSVADAQAMSADITRA
ncbi:MAG: Rrf2 family transcriptional regulator [Ilumatobacter sp.]|uniref:Rrf2 family transcriptional regulator n=1 Tax=Ilumatobacter sp. TaxID=1967498 RepID=UPI003C72D693